jgi:hypothetical protein
MPRESCVQVIRRELAADDELFHRLAASMQINRCGLHALVVLVLCQLVICKQSTSNELNLYNACAKS